MNEFAERGLSSFSFVQLLRSHVPHLFEMISAYRRNQLFVAPSEIQVRIA